MTHEEAFKPQVAQVMREIEGWNNIHDDDTRAEIWRVIWTATMKAHQEADTAARRECAEIASQYKNAASAVLDRKNKHGSVVAMAASKATAQGIEVEILATIKEPK
jgi:hypothetical protein